MGVRFSPYSAQPGIFRPYAKVRTIIAAHYTARPARSQSKNALYDRRTRIKSVRNNDVDVTIFN